ncbi:MAG: Putative TonB-dependent receptor [uncultured Gemmatimonadaceae bacterium]|uniref:TonB-dependent receptor n=1 Tax=uncultured Gemmatimonadaceae bacterium TaxID=246130 RepID=A0A6J4MJ39_9BACT|nr:MAG: Putative TonB-dependent receptor [uncultured Gemmatimonadaceae bacterium]
MRIPSARRALSAACLLFFAAAGAAGAAPADAPAPPLTGLVTDSAGTPLPNVSIVVAEVSRVTTTNAEGRFAFSGLPAGSYHLNVLLIGYRPAHVVVALPAAGEAVRLEIVLAPSTVRLQGVQVTATPTGTDPLNITQSTVELSGKELQRTLGASVAQTLSAEPGLSVRYNGPAANTPVIRGLTGERILVLQDGERAGDLSSASADHGLSVDPLAAQRIEVVRGPASLLYGNNALGGVVNVISNDIPTNVPSHVEGYVGGQAESVNPGGAGSAAVTAPIGERFAVSARGGFRRIEDVRQGGELGRLLGTDSRNEQGTAGLAYVGGAASAGLAYRLYNFNYGLPSAPGAEEAGVRLDGRRQQLSGRTAVEIKNSPVNYLRLDGSAQWYNHDEIEPSGEVATRFNLRTQTVNLNGRTQIGRATGAVGLSGLFRQYEAEGEEALTPAADNSSVGAFVYQEVPLTTRSLAEARTPRLQVGARYDLFRITSKDGGEQFGPGQSRDFNNASGSVGVSIPLSDAVSVSGSVARAFRAPTVEELFSNAFHAATGTFDVGDSTLAAETNSGIDGVVRVQSGRTSAQLSAYYNRVNDYITPVVDGETEADGAVVPVARFRQADAALRGIEGQAEVEVARYLVVGAMGDVVRGRFRDGGAPIGAVGDAIPFLPPARLGGLVRWDNRRYSASADVRRAFAQDRTSQPGCAAAGSATGDAAGDATGAPCVDLPTAAYTLANVSVGLNLTTRGYVQTVTLRADNLFDERYYDAASRIKSFAASPGRNVSVVYRVLF